MQYAYARINSILDRIKAKNITFEGQLDIGKFEQAERRLYKKLLDYPQIIKTAALEMEPAHLATYAEEVASEFHKFYTLCPVISNDEQQMARRVKIITTTQQVIKKILDLLGVGAPERMESLKSEGQTDRGIEATPQERGIVSLSQDISKELAKEIIHYKENGWRVIAVLGPNVVHKDTVIELQWLVENGFIDAVFTGNAVAVHEIERQFFGTSPVNNLTTGRGVEGGNKNL